VAELWFRRGVNLEYPHEFVLAVVVDPDGEPADRAVAQLGLYSYEGDGVMYLLQTDGWAEQSLVGDVVTVDVVAYSAVLQKLRIDEAGFGERSPIEPEAVRLLRVSAVVDVAEYQRAPVTAVVLEAPVGTTFEQMLAMIGDGETEPIVLATPPGSDD
jgi:hypothetical protein